MLFKTIRQGAQTTIHCAIDDDVPNHNGDYFRLDIDLTIKIRSWNLGLILHAFCFRDCKPARCSAQSKDEMSARKLWEISEELTKINY